MRAIIEGATFGVAALAMMLGGAPGWSYALLAVCASRSSSLANGIAMSAMQSSVNARLLEIKGLVDQGRS